MCKGSTTEVKVSLSSKTLSSDNSERYIVDINLLQCTGALIVLCFLYLLGFSERLITLLVVVAYPALQSFNAINIPEKHDRHWLTYWIIFAIFQCLEYDPEYISSYFSIYWQIKASILLYLYLPFTRGAEKVYDICIGPLVLQIRLLIRSIFGHKSKSRLERPGRKLGPQHVTRLQNIEAKKDLSKEVKKLKHQFIKIDAISGRIENSVPGNVIFAMGGKDNSICELGKVMLDNTLAGKYKRKIAGSRKFLLYRNTCLSGGCLFIDPKFPAEDTSICFSKSLKEGIIWRRPAEIVDSPQLFSNNHSRFDVIQGCIENCWVLAAMATLTVNEELFHRVVPPNQSFTENYCGFSPLLYEAGFEMDLYFFLQHTCTYCSSEGKIFWRYGKWVDVVIDDRLPTMNGKLLFLHSTSGGEFWSALLEKAYAKLHGSYEALEGGQMAEALNDFTGGISEIVCIKERPMDIIDVLFNSFETRSLLGASIKSKTGKKEYLASGLISAHAYSITKLQHTRVTRKYKVRKTKRVLMIRIRNPWGKVDWKGPWCNGSPKWDRVSAQTKRLMELPFERDGEFWMDLKDFIIHFDFLDVCNLGPTVWTDIHQLTGIKQKLEKRWFSHNFHGKWAVADNTAGGCRNYDTFANNPQLSISVLASAVSHGQPGHCTMVIALMQKLRREKRSTGIYMLNIGYTLFQVAHKPEFRLSNDTINGNNALVSVEYSNLREVTKRFALANGEYVVVPTTFMPNQEALFMMRIFTDKPSAVSGEMKGPE